MHSLPFRRFTFMLVILFGMCLPGSIVRAQEGALPVPEVTLLDQIGETALEPQPREPMGGAEEPSQEDVGAAAADATIFSESFSGAFPGAWTVAHEGGVTSCGWRWPRGYASGCVNASNLGMWYPNNLHAYMQRQVSLVGYQSATLALDVAVDTETNHDKLTLKVRDQSGVWRSHIVWTGSSAFTYIRRTVDLSRYAGQSNLIIRFQFDTDGSWDGAYGEWDGVAIDNIVLSGTAATTCTTNRNPVDVVLAIDRSGSMRYDLASEKAAANGFADRMYFARDQAALVSFSDYAILDQTLTHDGALVRRKIDSLVYGGWTNISGAIRIAHAELMGSRHNPSAKRVLILMTDGKPEEVDTAAQARTAAREAKAAGIYIFVLGLGDDIDADLLRDIASSPGDYYQPPTANDLAAIYQQIAQVVTICKPAKPATVVACDGVYTDRIRVVWSSVSTAIRYEVWRSGNSSRANARRVGIRTEAYGDYNVVVGRPYWYWVRACNWNSCGPFSDPSTGWRRMTPVWLPSIPAYGNIPGGDRTHPIEMRYKFSGQAGEVYLVFQTWDVDNNGEIAVYVNDRLVAYAPAGRNNAWAGPYAILLTDSQVNDAVTNFVTFRNRYNPPNGSTWGVRKVAVAPLLRSALESLELLESGVPPVVFLPMLQGAPVPDETTTVTEVTPEEDLPIVVVMTEDLPDLVDTQLLPDEVESDEIGVAGDPVETNEPVDVEPAAAEGVLPDEVELTSTEDDARVEAEPLLLEESSALPALRLPLILSDEND